MAKRAPATVGQIKPAPYNPRQISDIELEVLKRSLREFGDLSGVVVNVRTGNLVGGHQRIKTLDPAWRIVKRPAKDNVGTVALGYIDTPNQGRLSYREVDWELKREKAANLAANKIQGEWDNEKLANVLTQLVELPEFQVTGFTNQEANLIIEAFPDIESTANEDEVPLRPTRATTRIGQLWKLGPHRLLCADATKPDSWERLLDGEKAALCITDPPYGEGYEVSNKSEYNPVTRNRKPHRSRPRISGDESTETALAALPELFAHLIDDGVAYVTCTTDLAVDLITWLRQHDIHYGTLMVWQKHFQVVSWNRYHAEHELIVFCGKGSRPGKFARWFGPKNETTVWDIPLDVHGERSHPTQKPVALYERAMVNSSAIGEIVVDPFAGSGSCLVAAEKHRRRAYLMEIDPCYCDVIVKRWMNLTGDKPREARRI